MHTKEKIEFISNWIKDYAHSNNVDALVIGISGGIDSAVTSTLSAKTGLKTFVANMPILDHKTTNERGINHIDWLKKNFSNVTDFKIDLSLVFESFKSALDKNDSEHGYANSQARLRMMTLYQIAASNNGIVVGTGNKVEDFGIGFYTKYGDGGVDISPIADCLKTEVWDMGKELNINQDIIDAAPTDGLWTDGRSDEDQVGLSYSEIEEAMLNENSSNRQKYLEIRKNNLNNSTNLDDATLGIRPDDILISDNGKHSCVANLVEYLGSDMIIYSKIGDQEFSCKLSSKINLNAGDTFKFDISGTSVHLFDNTTGSRV